jgi:hypothetical protein
MTVRDEFIETIVGTPPTGWTLGHVTLQLYRPEERVPVEAWRCGAFAVHQVQRELPARLTHAPTGLRIDDFETMDDAVMCAEQIEPFTDWAAITKRFETGSDLYPRVKAVANVVKWRPSEHAPVPLQEGNTP